MKRILLVALIVVSFVAGAFAQEAEPYNKKETKAFVERVKELMTSSDRGWWMDTQTELSIRRAQFDENEKRVNDAWDLYDAGEYWRCNEAVSELHLDKTSARAETRRNLNALDRKLMSIRGKINYIESNLTSYCELYNNSQYEELLPLAKEKDFLNCVNPINKEAAETLFSNICTMASQYDDILRETIAKPESELSWGCFDQIYR